MNKKLVLLGASLLLTAASASAQKLVTGKVTDSHGEPVMGATVRVPGTKILTTTDASGNFKLSNVPASAKKLNVSFIGMQPTTVSVAGNVSVVLKDNELGEAVVIGYGSAKKLGTVVGSVKKVGSEKINGQPVVDASDALQGKVSGLTVLNSSGDAGSLGNVSMQIRGAGSLSASNYPLIVIDGSPAGSAMFSMLNNNDIESYTVLKDASATSIYGSRAANGVIFITTKRGRAGEKAQINIGQKIGWSQLSSPASHNMMNASELLNFQLENGVITATQYAKYKALGYNTNWQKFNFDNAAPMYNTDFSVRGGSGNTTYFVSGSYMKQNSITKISHFKRYTFRTNLETKPKDWMALGVRQNITYTDRLADGYTNQDRGNSLYNASTSSYWFPAYWGTDLDENHQYIGSEMIGGVYDRYWLSAMQPRTYNDVVYNGVGYITLTPVKGLTIKSQLGLYATDTRSSRSVSTAFPGNNNIGQASETHSRSSVWTITNTAEYKFGFTTGNDNKHELTFLAGHEGIKSTTKGFGFSGTGITDDRLNNIGSTIIDLTSSTSKSYSYAKYEYLSFFGRGDYSLNNKYFANFTIRNDQSSRFGAENRGAIFLSGGLMWNIMNEDFMAVTKGWLTDLQVKFSVGTTGNSEIGNYNSLGLLGNTTYNGTSGWVLSQPANEKLGWEKQIQYNFGFTARLFDRLNVDFNAYKRNTTNMLMSMPLPYTTGFSSQTVNVGKMSNRGVELELGYDVYRTKDAFVNIYANYSYNVNRIDELFNGLSEWPVPEGALNYIVGKSLNYYLPVFAGIDKTDGKQMWYKAGYQGNGKAVYEYNPETMTKNYTDDLFQDTGKKITAPHVGGFGFTASWKGLTLTADFSYVLGKYMLNNDYYFQISSTNAAQGLNVSKEMLNMWKKPGDETTIAAFSEQSQFDTRVLQNASFMRLKNLSLSYNLPKRWMEATHFFENVRLNFTTRNLFTVTKYTGSDPEVDSNIGIGSYPATRQFTLGIDVTF